MKPRGPLMTEHRVIEKMLAIVKKKVLEAGAERRVDVLFIDTMVDFIITYADRTHHGKEEEILFKQLLTKNMNKRDTGLLYELIDEHKQARKKVKEIVEAKERYLKGDAASREAILAIMTWLIDFYPRHIAKEDKEFFPATEAYFSAEELDQVLAEFWEFDRMMIHEKYRNVVKSLQ